MKVNVDWLALYHGKAMSQTLAFKYEHELFLTIKNFLFTRDIGEGMELWMVACRVRVTCLVDENLPLTQFPQLWQLLGRYCSCLLPRQDDSTPKNQVNRRFSLTRCVTLYTATGTMIGDESIKSCRCLKRNLP